MSLLDLPGSMRKASRLLHRWQEAGGFASRLLVSQRLRRLSCRADLKAVGGAIEIGNGKVEEGGESELYGPAQLGLTKLEVSGSPGDVTGH